MKKLMAALVFTTITSIVVISYSHFQLMHHTPANFTVTSCEVPLNAFKSWEDGIVTTLKPLIHRDCKKILAGDQEEIERVQKEKNNWKNTLSDDNILQMTENCSQVVDYFQDNLFETKMEKDFPIAYMFVVHNSPQQVLRLLRLLYRPTNTYCIHPDSKSSGTFFKIFKNLQGCMDNVIVASRLASVEWGKPTILEAQMSCLKDLVLYRIAMPEHRKWKYVINLCGKELPLFSAHTIVTHLSKLNGTSAIKAHRAVDRESMQRLNRKTLPFNLTYYKSMTYMALSYRFAYYLLTNMTAIELCQFFMKCSNPEEHFYATLYMIPGTPGGYNPNMPQDRYFHISKTIWVNRDHPNATCKGKTIHMVCIVSIGDLKGVVKSSEREMHTHNRAFFHNKYFMEFDHTVMDCMEERLVEENKREYEVDCAK